MRRSALSPQILLLAIIVQKLIPAYAGLTRPSFVSDEMIATAASIVNACQIQTGVATADIESVRSGQWPDTQNLKQFGLIDRKQEIDVNSMLIFLQRVPAYRMEVQKAIMDCKASATGETCEYAFTFNKCYAKKSPKTYYLF